MIAVVHLVWGPYGPSLLRNFVNSYRRHPAGVDHQLVILFNAVSSRERPAFLAELASVEHTLVELSEPVLDLPAYAQATAQLDQQRVCFVNSHSEILVPDWLAKLNSALDQSGAGLVGASGSWASIRSLVRFQLGFGGAYAPLLRDRHAVTGTFEAITGPAEASPEPRRRIPVVTYLSLLFDQLRGTTSFPAAHIRTTGFMVDRAVFQQLGIAGIRSKNDAYRLESGRHSLTAQVERLGLSALVAGADGGCWPKEEWFASRTFWQANQENLLVADKQTAFYDRAGPQAREVLSRYAWGPRADPSPADASAAEGPRESRERSMQ